MRIIIEDQKVKHIPVLDVYNANPSERQPLVFMLHGLTSSKETGLTNAYRFVRQGFRIVLFDAYRHGELTDAGFQTLDYFEKTMETTDIIRETVQYLKILIDYYQNIENVNGSRIGLIGFSMGGVIVYKYITGDRNPAVKAAVPVVASPTGGTLRTLIQKSPQPDKYWDEAKIAYAEREAPIHRLTKIKDFPLLMLNGVRDNRFSIEDVRDCYNQLQRNYTDKRKIKMIEYPDTGHQVIPEMIEEAISWFQKYL